MRFFMLLILLGCFSTLISSRPTGEGNGSETGDADDEGLEYSEEDEEDLSEEQQSARNEAVNQDEITEQDNKLSQESKSIIPDSRNDQNRVGYGTFSDIELDAKREQGQDKFNNLNLPHEKSYREMNHPNTYNEESNNAEETNEDLISRSNSHQRIESRNVNAGPVIAPDYSNDVLFKNNPENMNINENLRQDEQSHSIKQFYKRMHPENKNIERRKYDYSCNARERERRQVQTSESGQKDNENVNDNNENAIIKNIKKLSDKDLEELLDSLPEDKKALLKKIMEKREITKKAGAVDDNNGIEQSDTSKVEESYSEDSKSVFSSNTEASESKQEESEEMSTKTQENENTTGKSENKSGIDPNNNEDTLEVSIEAVTSNIDSKKDSADIISKDTSKNDNKREINSETLEKDIKFDDALVGKNSHDFSVDEMALSTDNTDFYESNYKENKAQKREVPNSLLEAETLSDSIKSLEDSFPNANAYEDSESDMEPLIRVKRTKLDHRVEKRDLPQMTINDKIPFVPRFENEEIENEGSEFKDQSVLGHSSSYEQILETNKDKINAQQFIPRISKNTEFYKAENDKVGLGTDTDNVLSSIEGIDENIMFNNKARNRRVVKGKPDAIIRNERTIGPGETDSNSLTDNSLEVNQYERLEPFGALQQNTEEDLSRSKRVKRDKREPLTLV